MYLLIFVFIILSIVFLPGIWVQRVLATYSKPADRYSGTGAQLARFLLDKYGLQRLQERPALWAALSQHPQFDFLTGNHRDLLLRRH